MNSENFYTRVLSLIDDKPDPRLHDDLAKFQTSHHPDLPFPLPTLAFKHRRLAAFPLSETVATFVTSGTTAKESQGKHEFRTLQLYERSSIASFQNHFGHLPKVKWLSLVASRFESPQSSLAYMVDILAREFSNGDVVYAFHDGRVDLEIAMEALKESEKKNAPLFIPATTVALSDLLNFLIKHDVRISLPEGSALFETGGRKGRNNVASANELAKVAHRHLNIPTNRFHGEYGMTEMSSPSWGTLQNGKMIYLPPSWCPVTLIDPIKRNEVNVGEEGLISLFDFANVDSVSSLLTGDWGMRHATGFEVIGRASDRELRGCSLQVAPTTRSFTASTQSASQFSELKSKVRSAPKISLIETIEALSELSKQMLSSPFALDHPNFSPGSVKEGLRYTFEALTKKELEDACRKAWRGKRLDVSNKLAISISAGNLPITGVFNYYAFLLAGVPSIHRPHSGDTLLTLLHKTLTEISPKLAARTEIVFTSSEDDAITRQLFTEADWILAQGDDSTLEHLVSLAPSQTCFVPFGSKFSAALIPEGVALTEHDINALLSDIYIWEQQGCLSPQVIYGPTPDTMLIDRFFTLAASRAKMWNRVPNKRRAGAIYWAELESRFTHPTTRFFHSEQLSLAVTNHIEPKWFSTPGFVQWVTTPPTFPIPSLSSLAVPSVATTESYDVNRCVLLGELQAPSFGWHHDGVDRLGIFTSGFLKQI